MLKDIARLLGGVPGVTVSLRLEVDPNATTEESTQYRGLVIIGCLHARAKEVFSEKMKAKNFTPIPLRGTAEEIEQDIMQGKVLGRIQERLVLAKEAVEEDVKAKEVKAAAKTETAAAPKKAAAKTAPAKPAPKTPEELKEIGAKVGSQTSLLDQAEETEAPAKPQAPAPSEAKMEAPQVGPSGKKAQQFVDLVDELEFAVNSAKKKIALEKIEKINALGKELNGLGVFKKGTPGYVQEAMDAYLKQKNLKAKAAELPEDDNDAPLFDEQPAEEASFED